MPPHFRPSINGLRGIAILWVILFHWCHVLGGFTGVDIFFVISGYLISGHIVRELEKNEFSFLAFFAKRARRIFPALIMILLFVFFIAQRYALLEDYTSVGKHLRAGALFFTNFQLFSETGYFDATAESKPLLHLWSLAVEEQFYLVWPVLLFFVYRAFKKTIPFAIAIMIASFGINLYWTATDQSNMAFYFLPARLWELAAGYLVYESESRFRKFYDSPITQMIGLALLILSAIVVRSTGFPGWSALIPVIGAALLIGGSEKAIVNRYVLAPRFLGFFGSLSFALYLWHWPLFSFMKTLFLEEHMAALVVCTLLFSYLTHLCIEKPFMHLKVTVANRKKIVTLGLLALFSFAAVGTFASLGKIPSRMSTQGLPAWTGDRTVPACLQEMDGRVPFSKERLAPCLQIKFPKKPVVLLIGDSHANSIQAGIQPFLESHEINLVTLSVAFCSPFSFKDKSAECVTYNRYAESWIRENKPDVVIIATHYLNWQRPNRYYQDSIPYYDFVIERALNFQKDTGKKVLLIGQNPTWHGTLPRILNIAFLTKGLPVPERTLIGQETESLSADAIMKEKAASAKLPYFSMKETMCNEVGCLVRCGENLTTDLMTLDYGHITAAGATYAVKNGLGETLLSLLKQ